MGAERAGASDREPPATREKSSMWGASPGGRANRPASFTEGGLNRSSAGAEGVLIIRVNSPGPVLPGSDAKGGPGCGGGAWNIRVNSPAPPGGDGAGSGGAELSKRHGSSSGGGVVGRVPACIERVNSPGPASGGQEGVAVGGCALCKVGGAAFGEAGGRLAPNIRRVNSPGSLAAEGGDVAGGWACETG